MPTDPLERPRLAAVVFTDVVGYSARMQRDEAATIAAVQQDFARMREACAERGGEVLNTMGDGMMLCFGSAVDAVRFALQVQSEFGQRNAALEAGTGLEHRVGIHLGDVFRVEGGHVAGDGVNIAARLESKAPAGGVCISQTVYDTVRGKVAMHADFMGPQGFKNIAEPIPVWHVSAEGAAARPSRPATAGATSAGVRSRSRRSLVAGGSALLAVAAVGGAYWVRRDTVPTGTTAAAGGGGDKSIAVLPFTNMSADKDAAYFADGIHEDLLTQLALLSELKVVSRTSVMEYRDSAKNMRQIGKELGVGALVEGSVRRAGNQVRVTAQLIDAGSDKHLWASNYDRELKDIFAVQSELATAIAGALRVSLTPPEQVRLASKPTANLQAYDLFLRHQDLVNSAEGGVRAISSVMDRVALLTKAVELDPAFALAWARLAAEHGRAKGFGYDASDARRAQARAAMDKALALAPEDLQVKIEEGAFYLHAMDDHARALQAYGHVLKAAPNNLPALYGQAEVYRELGQATGAVAALEKALAVDPRHAGALGRLAGTYIRYRHYDRALALRRQLIAVRPTDLDLQATYYLHDYWATGAWDKFDQWRATLEKGVESKFAIIRNTDADRAISKRDFEEVKRLIDVDSEDFKRGADAGDQAVSAATEALRMAAAGNRTQAEGTARTALSQIDAELRKAPANHTLLTYKALMHALLGQRESAFAAFEGSVKGALSGGNLFLGERVKNRIVGVHALLGETAQANAELRKRLPHPGTFIHDLRVSLELAPLWDDPEFKRIVADPASNAPLPLTLKL